VSVSAAPVEPTEGVELDLVARQPSGAALGRMASGALAVIGPSDPCGECEVCRRGGAAVCAHARPRDRDAWKVQISGRWIVELGDGLDLPAPAAAAVGGDVALAYTLYARTGLAPRDPVVVLGDTAVTRFLVEILRAKGLTPVVVTARPEIAAAGAIVVGEPAGVAAATATLGLGERPLRVIATAPEVVEAAAQLAGPRATLTVLAPAGGLPGELIAREVTIIGVAGAHPDLVTEAAAMCAKGEIDLAGGVTVDPGDPTRALVIVRS
jgi:L-idonate 5-dehydrogenase